MIDRFYGFRYEVFNCHDQNYELHIQKLADNMGCFGWIQRLPLHSNGEVVKVVGEARCSKTQGPLFQNHIKDDCKTNNNHIVYNDKVINNVYISTLLE
jgi:hypothetical protein